MFKFYEFNMIEKDHPLINNKNITWIKDNLGYSTYSPMENSIIQYELKDVYFNFRNQMITDQKEILQEQLKRALFKSKQKIEEHRVSQKQNVSFLRNRFKTQRKENKKVFDYTGTHRTPSAINNRGKRISHMHFGYDKC